MKHSIKFSFKFIILSVLLISNLYAQKNDTLKNDIDTLRIDAKCLLTNDLQEKTNQYLVYIHGKEISKVMNISVWSRTVTFSKWNGQDAILISQAWYSQDTTATRTIFSVSDRVTFKPIYHYAKSSRQGIEAFNFEQNKIVGADTVANNTRKGWSIDTKEASLNWELDMEILAILPYKEGKTFAVNFYHPGSKMTPQYYLYKVIDSEKLETATNQSIDCWRVRIDYNSTMYATFWIGKKTREVLKMKEFFGAGYRYKVKLGVNME